MIRFIIALLLTVNLLACPVRCLSCETNVVMGGEFVPAGCQCCSDSKEGPDSKTSEPSGDDCNCQNCICEGAVVEADANLPDSTDQSEQQSEHWGWPTMAANPTSVRQAQALLRSSAVPIGHFLCGRDVRVAHQSWLI
jgi:hypothetical protein